MVIRWLLWTMETRPTLEAVGKSNVTAIENNYTISPFYNNLHTPVLDSLQEMLWGELLWSTRIESTHEVAIIRVLDFLWLSPIHARPLSGGSQQTKGSLIIIQSICSIIPHRSSVIPVLSRMAMARSLTGGYVSCKLAVTYASNNYFDKTIHRLFHNSLTWLLCTR